MQRATGMLAASAAFFGGALSCAALDSSSLGVSLVATPGLYFFGYSLFRLQLVNQRRASDVVLSPSGLTIEGGARHGTTLSWPEIDAWRSELIVSEESLSATGNIHVTRLVLARTDGDTLLLAEAQTAEEAASLEALLASLRSSRWRAEGARGASKVDAPRIFACPACGAPAEPADVEAVACAYCGARVAVAADLRARIRAAAYTALNRGAVQSAVAQILRQPSAGAVNTMLLGVAAGGPLLGISALMFGEPGIYVAAVGIVACLYTGLVGAVGQRRAYRALVHLGAVEPDRPGAPHSCRRCHAPLPRARAGAIVLECIHCRAENVLGLDLRREAHERAGATAELTSALAFRRRSRIVSSMVLALGLLLTIAGVTWWCVSHAPPRHSGQAVIERSSTNASRIPDDCDA